MTPRSLILIIVKILGIFMLKEIIFSFVNLCYNFIAVSSGLYLEYSALIPSVISLLIYIAVFMLLLFKTDVVISKLKLDEGFYEEQFTLVMNSFIIFRIAIIVAGLYLLIDALPSFCKDCIAYYQTYMNNIYAATKNYNAQGIGYSGTKLVASYLLLMNSSYISKFITNKNKQEEQN